MGTMEVNLQCLLGLQCNNFAMIAADQTNTKSIVVMKNDEDKLHQVTDKLVMGIVGDAGDASQFAQFVSKNLQLYKMRNKYELDAAATVHFTRKNLADMLRSGNTPMMNMLIAGYDNQLGGQLFTLDFLASCMKVPFAVHGFGGILSLGILDYYHRNDLKMAEAYEILKLCVQEIHKRLFIHLPNFQVKVISKDGISELPIINAASFKVPK